VPTTALAAPVSPTDPTPTPTAKPHGRRLAAAVVAMAMGAFTIGTTEFVTMGLLPQIARGVDVSIPSAGHLVSAYAVGVVVGAPLIALLGARLPRRGLLLALMGVFAVTNGLSALATGFELLTVARFAAGLPHGAYLGIASLVAASMADPDRKGRAVAQVILGLSLANVVGVPAATWLGQNLGWRAAFVVVAALAALTVALIRAFVPATPADPHASARQELAAFTSSQVWLTMLAGAVGFGGMFAVYTYIAPTVTDVAGLPESTVPFFLLSFGLGMVVGTWLAGELGDWSVFRSLFAGAVGMGLLLLLYAAVAPFGWWLLPMPFLVAVGTAVLAINLQLRLMHVAGDAEILGAAANHASLNIANALGAWLGGVVVAAGLGYQAPALIGAALTVAGIVFLVASLGLHRRHVALGIASS
jgi:MFS transporter, DHA1 family, inner membrane transport protein